MKNPIRYLVFPLIYLLTMLPMVGMTTGCSSATTQAKVNATVLDIENWAPVVASDATALLTDLASFEPSDAAEIQSLVTQINTDVNPVVSLCQAYLANPSASILTQIAAAVNSAATANSQALLAVLNIKNANSQTIAKGVLTGIATVLAILTTYLATAGQTASITLPSNTILDQKLVNQAMEEAKRQNLIPQDTTEAQVMLQLKARGIIKFA